MRFPQNVIDGHFHFYDWFMKDGGTCFDRADEYRARMGFRAINVNAIPSYENGDVSNNMFAALYKAKHGDVYAHGGLMYPSYPVPEALPEEISPLTQYNELMEIGFDGIKMLETKPTEQRTCARPVSDPLYEPFFAAIERDGTHMVWHVADPAYFWDKDKMPPELVARGWLYDESFWTKEQIYQAVFTVLDRHPALKVTFAHFFFMSGETDRLEKVFAKYPGVNVDLTPGCEMYGDFGQDPAFFRDFFTRNADRIQYGTDSSDEIDPDYAEELSETVYRFVAEGGKIDKWSLSFEGLNLPEDVQRKILCENFTRRVAKTPRPINRAALKAYIAKYLPYVRDRATAEALAREAKTL